MTSDTQFKLKTIEDYLQSFEIFPNTLQFFIQNSSLRQEEIASRLNVDTSAISHWRQGRRMPDTGILFRLAKELNLTLPESKMLLANWLLQKQMMSVLDYVHEVQPDSDTTENTISIINDILAQTLSALGQIDD